jgi:hypothetical protein
MRFTIRDIRDNKGLRNFLRLRYRTEARTTSGNDFHVLVEYDTGEAIELIDAMIKKYKKIPKHARFIPKWERHRDTLKEMENGNSNTN